VQGLRAEYHIDVGSPLYDDVAFLAGYAATHTNDKVGVQLFEVLYAAEV